MWFWCYFVSIVITDKLLPNRVLNYVATILLLTITFELARKFIVYKDGSDDGNFIKEWEVKHRKGELNFVLLNGSIIAIAVVIMIGIYVVTNKVGVAARDLPFVLFISLVTGCLLTLTSWSINDQKYISLKERENRN